MMTHVPQCSLLLHNDLKVQMGGQTVSVFSFFRSHVRPEWEHPSNSLGTTLTARVGHMTHMEMENVWSKYPPNGIDVNPL